MTFSHKLIILVVRRLMISHLIIKCRINFTEKFQIDRKNFEHEHISLACEFHKIMKLQGRSELGGEWTVNEKWMESSFMLIHQMGHLAKYQALKEMESCGLKPNQAGILFVLRNEGGLSQKELAKRVGVTPPSMTAALKKLEKQGYILREQDEKDQRITRIQISDAGIQCMEGLKSMMRNLETGLYEGISKEERRELQQILLKMRDNILKYKEFKGMDMCEIMEKTRPPKMPGD